MKTPINESALYHEDGKSDVLTKFYILIQKANLSGYSVQMDNSVEYVGTSGIILKTTV